MSGHQRNNKYPEGVPSAQDSHRKRRPKRYEKNSPDALPGVQKLKSSLRQTRRLLAKDISPDVRVETERRLKSLEEDLARSGLARKERSLAIRYHKVKFFGELEIKCFYVSLNHWRPLSREAESHPQIK
jgi:hypothetical protein